MRIPAVLALSVFCICLAACNSRGGDIGTLSSLETGNIAPLATASVAAIPRPSETSGEPAPLPGDLPDPQFITIRNDNGGYVISYAVRMKKWRDSGTVVRFAGHCDSACTIFLALPRDQTCITRGTTFRFHSPAAASQRGRGVAQDYLMKTYPDWVRTWIVGRGGLSRRLITMDYDYARRFLRPCDQRAA